MNAAKCEAYDYINVLVATPFSYSCVEAAKVQPEQGNHPAHDAFTRLLHRLEPSADTLWHEAEAQVHKRQGVLIVDDTTLDKPYAKPMALVTRHGSGKHHQVVQGGLPPLPWTRGLGCSTGEGEQRVKLSRAGIAQG